MKKLIFQSAVFFVLVFLVCLPNGFCQAPTFEIPDGLVWLNSKKPLKVSEFKGKFVVVYFWSYAGLNIQAVVDQCRELEERYRQELVVIGVHTGKSLDTDDLNGKVAEALTSYRIHHPVAVDNQLETLKAFHVDRWPSAVLFAPDGKVLFRKTGERDLFYLFNKLIIKNLPLYESSLDKRIFQFQSPDKVPVESAAKINVVEAAADLPEKVLTPTLLGNISLDNSINQTVNAQIVKEPSAIEIIPPEDLQDILFEEEQRKIPISPKKFTGEKVYINREYSRKIGQVEFKFRIENDGELLGDQKSYVRIYTEGHEVLAEATIKELNTEIGLNRTIDSGKLHVEAVLYYCTKGQKAICRIKSLLFVLPLTDFDKTENIVIEHEIAGKSL